MATPIQYDVSSVSGGAAAYKGIPGPAEAAQAGEYKKNTPGLRKISWPLSNFTPPPIQQFN